MQGIEKNMEKQLIVRTFEPDMNALKRTAKQLAHMQDLSLNLYGNQGEVLIVITVRAHAQAAATELTESVAEQFELALGSAAYGRGRGSLAYFTAGALIQSESVIAAADPVMGEMLAEEFSHTKRGPAVFDFGEGTYRDSRFAAKVRKETERNADEDDDAQIAAARASAAARYAHADYGVASAGFDTNSEECYIAVAHRKYVYVRWFKNEGDVKKKAALAALNIVRCIEEKKSVENARCFKRDDDFDWEEPIVKKQGGKSKAPIVVLSVLIALLILACAYFFVHFSPFGEDESGAVPVENPQSISESVPAETETETETEVQPDTVSEPEQPESSNEPVSKVTGVVTPFG